MPFHVIKQLPDRRAFECFQFPSNFWPPVRPAQGRRSSFRTRKAS